ncbi:MAG: exodeoxyribonuclease III [Myxococcota bacterium]
MRTKFRVYSWNVNGMRSVAKKGLFDWMKKARADVIGFQETRALPEQLSPEVRKPKRWRSHFVAAERKGYSGVGMYARWAPDLAEAFSLGEARFDSEGRLQRLRFGALTIVNGYFPNGSGKNRDHSRVPYKLDFYRALFDQLEEARAAGERILVMGDFNTAHRPIDLARPKQNAKTSGFLDVEREELDRWLSSGWTDTFRHFEAGGGHYSWWSSRFGVREKNIGWRIDYILASPGVMPFLQRAAIDSKVMGSDHCPIHVDLDPGVLEG